MNRTTSFHPETPDGNELSVVIMFFR